MNVRWAVIPVAGLGTRLLPATKAIPKEMVPVVDRPAIQWVIESIAAAGVERIVLVSSAGKAAIEDHLDAAPLLEAALERRGRTEALAAVRRPAGLARVASVRQPAPLGLGHAVLMAREVVGEADFAVVLPDEIVLGEPPPLAQCLETARRHGDPVVGLTRVPPAEAGRYGIVQPRPGSESGDDGAGGPGEWVLDDLVEKPPPGEAPSDLAITGPYLLGADAFADLAALAPGAGGEIQLTDALRVLARRRTLRGRLVHGERLDVGHPLGFVQANVAVALADPELGPRLRDWLAARN